MKSRPFPQFAACHSRSRLSTVALCFSTIACVGFACADQLVSWNLPVSVSGDSTQGIPAKGLGVSFASGIALTGSKSSTVSSAGWRWYDNAITATDLDKALTENNYFAYNITASNIYDLSINGLGPTSFQKGGSAPNTLALLYSANDTWTSGNYRVVSTGIIIPSSSTDLSVALAGDLGGNPISLKAGSTGYFRMVYWGATTTTSGAIWIGNAADSNDFSLLGTATSTVVIHNLLWTGAVDSNWNTSASLKNWSDLDNSSSSAAFSSSDNATIDIPATIAVDGAGVDVGTLKVQNPSGTVTLSGGTLYGTLLTKSDDGTLRLGAPNTFTGGVNLNGGIIQIVDAAALGDQSTTISSGILSVDSAVSNLATPLVLGIGGGTIENPGSLTVAKVTNAIANNSLTKTGAGDLNFAQGLGVNNSGPVNLNISAGTVTVSGTQEIDLGNSVVLGGNLNLAGPRLELHKSEVTGTNAIVVQNSGAIIEPRFNAGTVNVRVPVVLQTDVTANVANDTNPMNFYGDISGPNNFVKTGNGPVFFRMDMSYTGTTTLRDKGSITLSGSGNLGQGDFLIDNVDARLIFEVSGETTVTNNIAGSGAVANSVNTQNPVNLTGILAYTGQTVINAGILRFDGVSPALTGGVHVLAAATPGTTGAIGGNGSIGSAVMVDNNAGLSSRIRDWTGVAGTGYDDLTVASLSIGGALVVKIDGTGLVNFTESTKSFTILTATSGITGFNPAAVSFVPKNFPGTGTFAIAQSGNSLVLNYTAAVTDPFTAFVTGPPYNLTGNDALPNADPDNDGISNAVEFVIGGNPANASDSGKLPTFAVNGSNFVFTFRRNAAAAYLNPSVQYSSTLSGWTTAVDGMNGITIGTANPTVEGLDVVVTIPKTLAVGGKLFARLNVVVP